MEAKEIVAYYRTNWYHDNIISFIVGKNKIIGKKYCFTLGAEVFFRSGKEEENIYRFYSLSHYLKVV